MKKLRFIPALAFVLGLSAPVFAGTPEGETKDAKESPSASAVAATATQDEDDQLYWFPTDASGNELMDATGIPVGQQPSATPPCNGSGDYCARGFSAAETSTATGKRLPIIPVSSGVGAQEN